jgi:hypothetical protein
MATKKTARKTAAKEQEFVCPCCNLMGLLRDMVDRKSPFFQHMDNARIEFLEGVKSLIDARIEGIKKGARSKKSTLTKIKVED